MIRAAENRIKFIQKLLERPDVSRESLKNTLDKLELDSVLSILPNLPFDPVKFFKRICKTLENKIDLEYACIMLTFLQPRKLQVIKHNSSPIQHKVDENKLWQKSIPHSQSGFIEPLKSQSPFYLKNGPKQQYLFIIPVHHSEKNPDKNLMGKLFLWLRTVENFEHYKIHLRYFTHFLADGIVKQKLDDADKIISSAKNYMSHEIKKVIQHCIDGLRYTIGCDYSIGLILNRSYSEYGAGPLPISDDHMFLRFEVVTEKRFMKGLSNRSNAVGLWLDENDGLLAEVISVWRKNNQKALKGLTFHQTEFDVEFFKCLETNNVRKSLRVADEDINEVTIYYFPLVNEKLLIGFLKLSFREKIILFELEKQIIQRICQFLSDRIRNSYIYSLDVAQARFLPQIKNLFESADKLELYDISQLRNLLSTLTDIVYKITNIDSLAIGYLTKDIDGKPIIRFPHPKGWAQKAQSLYHDLPATDGLCGLAIRLKSDVFLSPVEDPTRKDDPEPSVYVNEKIPHFVDTRKSAEYKHKPGYKRLANYYIKIHDDKVYADFVFLIKYKNMQLGVIDVEVTEKNWDRFLGLGYVYFFKTLANMLALFLYRLRLAEFQSHILNAIKRLNDAVFMSPQAVIKSILATLKIIYDVEKAKIIPCDIRKKPIKINHLNTAFEDDESLFIGYDRNELKRLFSLEDGINSDNLFLLELQHLIKTKHTFYLYIPDVQNYKPQKRSAVLREKFQSFRNVLYFNSYMGIELGDSNQSFGILELVSKEKNAFDQLLIDQNFLQIWVSQISMALNHAMIQQNLKDQTQKDAQQPKRSKMIHQVKAIPLTQKNQIVELYGLVGSGPSMEDLREIIRFASTARIDNTIFIVGETGTGKELVARAVHKLRYGNRGKFVDVNCAAIPWEILESELFGHMLGAFTGATKERIGKFVYAHRGTLFLDEIGDLPKELQPKLLRVLESRIVIPLGSNKSIPVKVLVIAATKQNLKEKVENGDFREDLLYRLDVIALKPPPLRVLIQEDPNNLIQLTSHLLYTYFPGNKFVGITEKSNFLLNYPFKGNVRELHNIIQKAIYDCHGKSILEILPEHCDMNHFSESSHNTGNIAKHFTKKINAEGIQSIDVNQVQNAIREYSKQPISKEEKIIQFVDKFGAIDIQIACFFTNLGKTWTRNILKQELHLTLQHKNNLYLKTPRL